MKRILALLAIGTLSGCAVAYHSVSPYPNPTHPRAAVFHCAYQAQLDHPSIGLVMALVNLDAIKHDQDACMLAYGYAPN
jgi:hypothetical protein